MFVYMCECLTYTETHLKHKLVTPRANKKRRKGKFML